MRASSSQWSSCYNHQPRRVEGFPKNYANPCSLLNLPPYPSRQGRTFPTFSVDPSKSTPTPITQSLPPLVVVGSADADIYVEIDRLPKEGETISARSGQTLAGGKGANQAACGGRLWYPTYFIGQVGEDAHGSLVRTALEDGGVNLGYCSVVDGVPTGQAVVMLLPDGQNSIIIVGGANTTGWPDVLPDEDLGFIKSAGIVLLQREIPDSVNIQVAKASASGFTAESCALWGLFCELGMLSGRHYLSSRRTILVHRDFSCWTYQECSRVPRLQGVLVFL